MKRLAFPIALILALPPILQARHVNPPTETTRAATAERITLKFLRPSEAALALKHIVPPDSIRLMNDGRLLLLDATHAQRAAARDLLARLDVAPGGVFRTTFVEIHHHPLKAIIRKAFEVVAVREAQFNAIPDPRTNRVFLMGHPDDVKRFADALQMLDRPIDDA